MIKMLEPEVLIISNKFDFSSDLIANRLYTSGASYIRLNRDQFAEYKINLDPVNAIMSVEIAGQQFLLTETSLKSIFFRAPTFLREIFSEQYTEEQQLGITQWAAFLRALTVFEKVRWVNNPVDTYRAEIKALQLRIARQSGFLVPDTKITNITSKGNGSMVAIKSIDTAIVSSGEQEAFVYTKILSDDTLESTHYEAPMFIQEALVPKIDIRVTVIGKELVAIQILGENGIDEDWRKYQQPVRYEVFDLPDDIRQRCLKLTSKMNLNFGGIDLVLHNGDYYFIEINPTGEWAWLQKNTGYKIDDMIVKILTA
jgi:hypothetical protein